MATSRSWPAARRARSICAVVDGSGGVGVAVVDSVGAGVTVTEGVSGSREATGVDSLELQPAKVRVAVRPRAAVRAAARFSMGMVPPYGRLSVGNTRSGQRQPERSVFEALSFRSES